MASIFVTNLPRLLRLSSHGLLLLVLCRPGAIKWIYYYSEKELWIRCLSPRVKRHDIWGRFVLDYAAWRLVRNVRHAPRPASASTGLQLLRLFALCEASCSRIAVVVRYRTFMAVIQCPIASIYTSSYAADRSLFLSVRIVFEFCVFEYVRAQEWHQNEWPSLNKVAGWACCRARARNQQVN